MNTFLADVVLGLHFAFVFFVITGLIAVWVGAAFGWPWIRNRWFRRLHLAAIMVVALEAIVGVACPLTLWENALRGESMQGTSFMQRYLGSILYHELPEWAFTAAYSSFAVAVAITYILIRPNKAARNARSDGDKGSFAINLQDRTGLANMPKTIAAPPLTGGRAKKGPVSPARRLS